MADPLSLLRDYTMQKKEIKQDADKIIFGDQSFHKNAKTNFIIYGSEQHGQPGQYYTVECLYYFIRHISLLHPIYVRQAAAEKIQIVRRPDRRSLIQFFKGEITSCPSIDKSASISLSLQIKRINQNNDQDIFKKPKQEPIRRTFEFDAVPNNVLNVNTIKPLSDTMSAEAIAAIKAKRIAKKRSMVKTIDYLPPINYNSNAEDIDEDGSKAIMSKERSYRNRTTILQASSKDFSKSVFGILNSIKARERAKEMPKPNVPSFPIRPGVTPQSHGYNRYDQERFVCRDDTAGFQINTLGTYHGMTLESVKKGQSGLIVPPPVVETELIKPKGVEKISKIPIIIVPGISTSLITLTNAKELLQDLSFILSAEKLNNGGRKPSNDLIIYREIKNGVKIPFRITDNPMKLKPQEWDYVVAAFSNGFLWEFKNWPWKDPAEVFSRVCGFHLKFDHLEVEANITKWNVEVIQISQSLRHRDRAVFKTIWFKIERFMEVNKPHIRCKA